MARILCAWLPNWPITAFRRRRASPSPAEDGRPLALVLAEKGVRRLAATDNAAAALGLFVGQKATDATALVPELWLEEADPAADHAALVALSGWCARFSPAVASDPPDGLFLDVTGIGHLWGGEATLAEDLSARLAAAAIPARIAVAASPGAAWALARFAADQPAVVEAADTARALAPLPIAALRLDPSTARQVGRLGLTAIADLLALPRAALARRFGADTLMRLDQALGVAAEALAFRRPPSPWLARRSLVEPISAPEDLARVTIDLARDLCRRLEAESLAAARFELAFHRLDGRAERLRLGLSLPDRAPDRLARLFLPRLEALDPGFGIEVATLRAFDVERREPRAVGFEEDPAAAPEAFAPLIDRLAARLGEDQIWRSEPFPSFAPERAVVRRPPLAPTAGKAWDAERPRPLRLFDRPEPIEAVAPIPDDPPVLFRWRGLAHRVRLAEGPERLAREWWRRPFVEAREGRVRDYYQVEDEAGARFWLYRDGLYDSRPAPRWWLHGLFG